MTEVLPWDHVNVKKGREYLEKEQDAQPDAAAGDGGGEVEEARHGRWTANRWCPAYRWTAKELYKLLNSRVSRGNASS